MSKGIWLKNLFRLYVKRELPLEEALSFGLARFRRKPVSIGIQGIRFENVDHILWSAIADVFVNKVYSPPGMEIQSGNTIVDIGAHRGAFTGYAARQIQSSVLAFEPHPSNFRSLQEFVEINRLLNVEIQPFAIGARTGRAFLYPSAMSSRHTIRGYDPVTGEKLTTKIDVNMLSLDDCLAKLNRVDLLKIDCEGAEVEILLNAQNHTLAKINRIVAEIHHPGSSPKIESLKNHLSNHFSRVTVVSQKTSQLGYIYAWKQI
jgi:FkbM family methyltransferase